MITTVCYNVGFFIKANAIFLCVRFNSVDTVRIAGLVRYKDTYPFVYSLGLNTKDMNNDVCINFQGFFYSSKLTIIQSCTIYQPSDGEINQRFLILVDI